MGLLATVGTAVLGKTLEKGVEGLAGAAAAGKAAKVKVDQSRARECLLTHMDVVEAWSRSITLLSLLRDKRLQDSFVELGLDLGLVRHGGGRREAVRVGDLFAADGHIAILGRPGAGKTTSLQRIAQYAIGAWTRGGGGVPVLVRLRDLRPEETLVSHLLTLFGIGVQMPAESSREMRQAWAKRVALPYLASVSAVLLVDGLDEIGGPTRREVEAELRDIALTPGPHRLFLTCRAADYHVPLQHVQPYTIRPLASGQVADFAQRWLGDRAKAFLTAVKRNPYSGTEVVPLTLAHLCAIYERDGELPPRPIDVYEQIVGLLIEEWDKQRGVRRPSRYADFSWRKKERFIQAVAYHLAMTGRKGSFAQQDLADVYGAIAAQFGLPLDEAHAVIDEVESHTGLVQLSGPRRYDFVHLVIQEFLTAMHAVRKAGAIRELVPGFPNELALVVAYSTSPEEYLELVLAEVYAHLARGVTLEFISPFLARLTVERPAWQLPAARAGWTFLALFDLVTRYELDVDTKLRERVRPDVVRLAADPAVRLAVARALAEAQRFDTTRAVHVVPRPHAALPPPVLEHLRSRPDAGLLLLRKEPAFQRLLEQTRLAAGRPQGRGTIRR
jgi:hypothetical protein